MIVHLKVMTVKNESGWTLVDNPHKLFRKSGEVEMRGVDSASLRFGEWVKFQVGPSERKDQWRATRHHRLYAYYDLSQAKSIEEARRILTLEGLSAHRPAGTWMVRIHDAQIIQVELARSGDDTLLGTHITTLPAYKYDPDSVVSMPTGTSDHLFYDLSSDVKPCHIYDWTPERGYIERVIRRLIGSQAPQMAQIISWLQQHTDEHTGRVTANPSDALAAHEALRSGELARRLAAEQTLLRAFADELVSDARIANLLERERKALIEEERCAIRQQIQTQLALETELQRSLCASELNAKLNEYEASHRAELMKRLDQERQETENALNAYQVAQKTEIDKVLGAQRAVVEQEKTELEEACAELSQRRDGLASALQTLETQAQDLNVLVADLKADLATLEGRKEQETVELERLKATATVVFNNRSPASTTVIPFHHPHTAQVWFCSEAGQIIKECALLTGEGKKLMEQFMALVLAGETPLLVGSDVEDFLLIAESLMASGRSARLEADPTLLTFEDLWVRAGTGLPTPLAQGIALASSENPRSILAVIERVERSGARFWLPALTDRARRGDLPRRFFLCATVDDVDCEEAEALRERQIWLQVDEAVARDAATVAPLWLSSGYRRELDPGDRPAEDIESALGVAHKLANRLGLVNTLRTVRAAAEVAAFYRGKDAIDAIARMNTLFLNSVGSEQPAVASN
jgi:hypothetical protein